ncbi:MAG: hypothetical protein IJW51_08230, partial [Clostridia bacterium]|nr:hypothetical protein [Clostridia bacterium]
MSEVFEALADIFLSQLAVGVYAIMLLILFIILIAAVMRYEKNAGEALHTAGEWARVLKELPLAAQNESTPEPETEEAEPSEPRFFMLGEIDAEMASYHRPPFDTKITLPELCEQFREFAASR